MRTPYLLFFVAPCILFCSTHTAFAQPIDSLRTVMLTDSSNRTFSLYIMGGASPGAGKALNSFAASNGFSGEAFSPDLLGGNFTLTEGIQLTLNHLVLAPEFFAILANRSSSGNRQIGLSCWGIKTNVGYRVYKSDHLNIYPLLAFAARSNRLMLNENIGITVQGTLDSANARSFTFTNQSLQIEAGIGIDYTFPLGENERSVSGLLVGLRAGYAFGIADDKWFVDNRELSDGPDMGASGVSIGLKIGYSTQTRVYDAQIVAERNSSSVEH